MQGVRRLQEPLHAGGVAREDQVVAAQVELLHGEGEEREQLPVVAHAAGQALLGTHDFSSYRAQACQAKSPVRELRRLTVRREGDLIEVVVAANSRVTDEVMAQVKGG